MTPTLILAILELLLNEANILAANTKAAPDVAIVSALEDTILKVKAKLDTDAGGPIDLDTLKDEAPIV